MTKQIEILLKDIPNGRRGAEYIRNKMIEAEIPLSMYEWRSTPKSIVVKELEK